MSRLMAVRKMLLYAATLIISMIGISRCDILSGQPPVCSCTYHSGGCVISDAAPIGYKCRCSYRGAWTCAGTAHPCVGKELCPGNLADYCACTLGEGDCGGYRNTVTACDSERPRSGVAGSATCNCQSSKGGCRITEPAPLGWKCVCIWVFWRCHGWAQQCSANEVCLGEDSSLCGCQQGGGDCGGYSDKPPCPVSYVSTSCNCDNASDWYKGLYTVDKVTFNTNNVSVHSMQPIVLAEKDIPNHTSQTQSISLRVSETLTSTSSFSNTGGIQIQAGTHFTVGIPFIADFRASVSITPSFSHTFGEAESISRSFDSTFTCNGAPRKHTKCTVTMQKGKVNLPYTMTVIHKIIPDCACESYGIWSGTQAYNAKLSTTEMANCYNKDCQ